MLIAITIKIGIKHNKQRKEIRLVLKKETYHKIIMVELKEMEKTAFMF